MKLPGPAEDFDFEIMKSCFCMRFEGKMPAAVTQCASESSLCNTYDIKISIPQWE